MKTTLCCALLGLGLAACSPALVQQPSKFAVADRVVCHDVVPVGSHLKERVCTTASASAEESKEAKAVLSEAQQRLRDDLAMERAMRSRVPRGP